LETIGLGIESLRVLLAVALPAVDILCVCCALPARSNCAPTLDKLRHFGLSLPSGSALSDGQFERLADAILGFVKAAA